MSNPLSVSADPEENTWKGLAKAYVAIGSIEECAHWKKVALSARDADGPISPSGSRSGSALDATPTITSPAADRPAEPSMSGALSELLARMRLRGVNEDDLSAIASYFTRMEERVFAAFVFPKKPAADRPVENSELPELLESLEQAARMTSLDYETDAGYRAVQNVWRRKVEELFASLQQQIAVRNSEVRVES